MQGLRRLLGFIAVGLLTLAVPGAASANLLTNGDFETGSLSGWQQSDASSGSSGSWFAYTGTSTPLFSNPVPFPPQGTYGAVTDQGGPGRHLLYQDFTLPPGPGESRLSLFVYYHSDAPITAQNNLDFTGPANQQYRVDVMRPTAALDSVASGDVLLSVFRTLTGDSDTLGPTTKTVDLGALAGQTLRLRFAEVDNSGPFNAGADAVAVDTNAFTLGTATRNKKKGTATVPVTVPDAGTVTLTGNGVKPAAADASKSVAVGAGTANLLVKAKGKKKRKLNRKGKAKVTVTITYTPNGLPANSKQLKLKLKKKLKKT